MTTGSQYALSKIYPRIYTSKMADALGRFRPESAPIITTGVRALVLTAAQGTFNETGQTTNLLWNHIIVASQGTYNETGQTTNLRRGYVIVAGQGTYNETGQTTNLLRNRLITAVQGTYNETGQTTNLLFGRRLIVPQGTYNETGQTTNLVYAHGNVLAAGSGLYAIGASVTNFTYSAVQPDIGPAGGYVIPYHRRRRHEAKEEKKPRPRVHKIVRVVFSVHFVGVGDLTITPEIHLPVPYTRPLPKPLHFRRVKFSGKSKADAKAPRLHDMLGFDDEADVEDVMHAIAML